MKVINAVCISDTHNKHEQLDLPKGDILIHAGDFSMMGTVEELTVFGQWLRGLIKKKHYKHVVVIGGNHDWLCQKNPHQAMQLLHGGGVTFLQDSATTIEGLRFYGSPWQPEFCNWAFNLERGAPLRRKWKLIPDDTDVLVTHGPPLGVGDGIPEIQGNLWEEREDARMVTRRVGCEDLWARVQQVQPQAHVFGHIHTAYGVYENGEGDRECRGTTFVNAASVNEQYSIVHDPIEIHLTVPS